MIRREASEACHAAIASGGERLVPSGFLCGKLQHGAHAGGVPGGREVGQILILGQQLQPVLERIFARRNREFIDEALQRKRRLQRVDRTHPAQRHRRFGHHVFDQIVGNAIDWTRLIGQIGIDSIRDRLAFLSADRRRDDAMRQSSGQAGTIQRGAELVQARGTVRGEAHVVFARPDDFYRSVDRFRDLRGFDRVIVLEPPAEASTHQRDVDFDLIGIKPDRRRDRIAAILRNLRRRPQLALRALIMRRAIARLHRRVRHEGQHVFGGDVASRNFRGIAGRIQVRTLLRRCLA